MRHNLSIVILATALGIALVVVTVAILWTALHNGKSGLAVTETDIQLLTGWGGGIIGVVGAHVGFRAGRGDTPDETAEPKLSAPRSDTNSPGSVS